MQINYYYPILKACVPPPQHVRSTKLRRNEIRDLTLGIKSSNFKKYFHVQRLATKNMTQGINGWSIFYNIDYLLQKYKSDALFNSKREWKPDIKNNSHNKFVTQFKRCEHRWNAAEWAQWKIGTYFHLTKTIEIKNKSKTGARGISKATRIFKLFGIEDPMATRQITNKTVDKQHKQAQEQKMQEDNLRQKLIRKLKKAWDPNLPTINFTRSQCLEILNVPNVDELTVLKMRHLLLQRVTASASNINLTAWDLKLLKNVNDANIQNLWPNADGEFQDCQNWKWLLFNPNEIRSSLALDKVDNHLYNLKTICWIIGLFYLRVKINECNNRELQQKKLELCHQIVSNLYLVYNKLKHINEYWSVKVNNFLTDTDWIGYAMLNIKYMIFFNKTNAAFVYANDKLFNAIVNNFASYSPQGQLKILSRIKTDEDVRTNEYLTNLLNDGLQHLLFAVFIDLVSIWGDDKECKNKIKSAWNLSDDWKNEYTTTVEANEKDKKNAVRNDQNKIQQRKSANKSKALKRAQKRASLKSQPHTKKRRKNPNPDISDNDNSDNDIPDYTRLSMFNFINENVPDDIFKDEQDGKQKMIEALQRSLKNLIVVKQWHDLSTNADVSMTNEDENNSDSENDNDNDMNGNSNSNSNKNVNKQRKKSKSKQKSNKAKHKSSKKSKKEMNEDDDDEEEDDQQPQDEDDDDDQSENAYEDEDDDDEEEDDQQLQDEANDEDADSVVEKHKNHKRKHRKAPNTTQSKKKKVKSNKESKKSNKRNDSSAKNRRKRSASK